MRPSTGRHHTWINPRDFGFLHLGDYLSCRDCGVIRSELNRNADNCPGVVEVALRSAARIEPGWRKAPPTVDEVRTCPWWWNQASRDCAPRILELDIDDSTDDVDDDVDIVIVYRGGASFSSSDRFDPARWGGAEGAWAPCLPPAAEWAPGGSCANNSPPWFTGRWRDWHRGHGCDKDDGKPRTDEGEAEIRAGGRIR